MVHHLILPRSTNVCNSVLVHHLKKTAIKFGNRSIALNRQEINIGHLGLTFSYVFAISSNLNDIL